MCEPRYIARLARGSAEMKHIPNALTIARIIVTPMLLVLLLTGTFIGQLSALILFILAAISDYLDGKLARVYKAGSRLGQFLDPFADKVLVLGTFAVLSYLLPNQVPWWGVVLIALRDVGVTWLRSHAEARNRSLCTLPIAKAKTAVQLTFIITLLVLLTAEKLPALGVVHEAVVWILDSPIIFIAMMFVVAFTLYTGIIYLFKQEYNAPV